MDTASVCVFFTSAFSGNYQSLLLLAPAHGSASCEAKHVGVFRGETCDSELASIGAHFHSSPPQRVPAVKAVWYLVA